MAKGREKKTTEGVEPLTVSISLGATIPTGEFGNVRPSIEIRNIRLDQDVEAQVKCAIEAAGPAWLAIDAEIESKVMDMLAVASGDHPETVRERLKKLEAWRGRVNSAIDKITTEVKRHKTKLGGDDEAGSA